jgi:hypothetical protein
VPEGERAARTVEPGDAVYFVRKHVGEQGRAFGGGVGVVAVDHAVEVARDLAQHHAQEQVEQAACHANEQRAHEGKRHQKHPEHRILERRREQRGDTEAHQCAQ